MLNDATYDMDVRLPSGRKESGNVYSGCEGMAVQVDDCVRAKGAWLTGDADATAHASAPAPPPLPRHVHAVPPRRTHVVPLQSVVGLLPTVAVPQRLCGAPVVNVQRDVRLLRVDIRRAGSARAAAHRIGSG